MKSATTKTEVKLTISVFKSKRFENLHSDRCGSWLYRDEFK